MHRKMKEKKRNELLINYHFMLINPAITFWIFVFWYFQKYTKSLLKFKIVKISALLKKDELGFFHEDLG